LLCLYGLKLHFCLRWPSWQLIVNKKLGTTFSVFIETLWSEKLQFYKIYMKSSVLHELLLHIDIHYNLWQLNSKSFQGTCPKKAHSQFTTISGSLKCAQIYPHLSGNSFRKILRTPLLDYAHSNSSNVRLNYLSVSITVHASWIYPERTVHLVQTYSNSLKNSIQNCRGVFMQPISQKFWKFCRHLAEIGNLVSN